jgi:hypothetical protein
MGKNQSASNLTNIIKQDASGNITFVSGSTTLMSVSSSGAVTTTGNVAGTASYASNAELLDGLDSTVFTLTSSFAAQTASFTAFTASQNILNGKYATTGSNTFTGIQTVNSNLVVTGSITAQTLVVQTITSSVDFVTGSTRFGSLLANTHVFSGSVTMNPGGLFVSGSGLVGIGTSSPTYDLTLSKSVAAGSVVLNIENTSTTGAARLWFGNNASSAGAKIQYFGATHAARPNLFSIGTEAANDMIFETSGTERMRITSGGNVGIATTSSPTVSQTGGGLALGDGTGQKGIRFDVGSGGWGYIEFYETSTAKWISGFRSADNSYNIKTGTNLSTGNGLSIASTGAATFSSTISAGAATFSGKVIGNGFNSFSGEISIASGVTSTIYTMGDNGLYTVQIIVGGGSLIYSAAAIFYSHSNNGQFVKTIDLYDGANVTLDNSGSAIRITNNGFATLTWNWSILHQRF